MSEGTSKESGRSLQLKRARQAVAFINSGHAHTKHLPAEVIETLSTIVKGLDHIDTWPESWSKQQRHFTCAVTSIQKEFTTESPFTEDSPSVPSVVRPAVSPVTVPSVTIPSVTPTPEDRLRLERAGRSESTSTSSHGSSSIPSPFQKRIMAPPEDRRRKATAETPREEIRDSTDNRETSVEEEYARPPTNPSVPPETNAGFSDNQLKLLNNMFSVALESTLEKLLDKHGKRSKNKSRPRKDPEPTMSGALERTPRKYRHAREPEVPSEPSGSDSDSDERPRRHHGRKHHPRSRTRSRSRSVDPDSDETSSDEDRLEKRWKIEELGLFDPNLARSYGTGEMVEVGTKMYFRDVDMFLESAEIACETHDSKTVRRHLHQCLRGAAYRWYVDFLSKTERKLLRHGNKLKHWSAHLRDRFRDPLTVSIRMLQKEFTLSDFQAGRDPMDFLQRILRHARSIHTTTEAQLHWAWSKLDSRLRQHIPQPSKYTTTDEFMDMIKRNRDGIWLDLYRTRFPSVTQGNTNFRNTPPANRGRYSTYPTRGQYSNSYSNTYPNTYPNYQFQRQPDANAKALPAPAQQRMITYPNQPKDASQSRGPYQRDYPRNSSRGDFQRGGFRNSTRNGRYVGRGRGYGRPYSQGNRPEAYQTEEYERDDRQHYEGDEEYTEETPEHHPEQEDTHPDANQACEDQQSDEEGGVNVESNTDDLHPQAFHALSSVLSYQCRSCSEGFDSKNALWKHIKASSHYAPEANVMTANLTSAMLTSGVIESKVSPVPGTKGLGFRAWHYATANIGLTPDGPRYSICVDSGCTVSLVDKVFIENSGITVQQTKKPMQVRGIGNHLHDCSSYCTMPIYMDGKVGEQPATALFYGEFHVVDKLDARALLGVDVLAPQMANICFQSMTISIPSCKDIKVPINIRPRGSRKAEIAVRTKQRTVIPPRVMSTIAIEGKFDQLPESCDLLFEPKHLPLSWGQTGGLYTHVVPRDVSFVHAYNASTQPVILERHLRIGTIVDYDEEGHFPTAASYHGLARVGSARSPDPKTANDFSIASRVGNEITLANGITMYGRTEGEVRTLIKVMQKFPNLWKDPGIIDMPEKEWMTIPLVEDWKKVAKFSAKVYPLGQEGRDLVDKTFDALHESGKMSWSHGPSPFGCPVFVVWKTTNGIRKGRVVVDIRPLNKVTEMDNYPMPLQEDILNAIAECPYVTTLDAVSFFYQMPLAPGDRFKVAVNTHRGQEIFNVCPMGAQNSPAHAQRSQDNWLRDCRDFARAYVDDTVVFSKTLPEHVEHLTRVFQVYSNIGLTLSPAKSFVAYPDTKLLGQRVCSLGMATHEDKIDAIAKLQFPRSLAQLEHYLGLTGWLRDYVYGYAAVTAPLSKLKTELIRSIPKEDAVNSKRKRAAHKLSIQSPTKSQLDAFDYLQKYLQQEKFLHHFRPRSILYADLDSSLEVGMGAVFYHLNSDSNDNQASAVAPTDMKKGDIQPILYLSRGLQSAETRYWPTELEVAGLVWILRKMRHRIESAYRTVIHTDHSATVQIAQQTSMTSSSTDRANIRLIRASLYIGQFPKLTIIHKAGKANVVPDALSRLLKDRSLCENAPLEGELEDLCDNAYSTHVVLPDLPDLPERPVAWLIAHESVMSDELRKDISLSYFKDPRWASLIGLMRKGAQSPQNEHSFFWDQSLLYYSDPTGRNRLCIPRDFEKTVLKEAHDDRGHPGLDKTYHHLIESVYMLNIIQTLKKYLAFCQTCQLNKTKNHKPFGLLKPIRSPPIPGHTMSIDFFGALPVSTDGMDTVLTRTDKFSKHIDLIPGKSTWSAVDWARLFVNRCRTTLGIPAVIISDQDPKFTSAFWKELFRKLGTRLITTTAYHPQGDGQSEATNKTVESALRLMLFDTNMHKEWPELLPVIQLCVNNNKQASTTMSPNEVVFGMKLREGSMLDPSGPRGPSELADPSELHPSRASIQTNRSTVTDALAIAQLRMKVYYDARRSHKELTEGDWVYLNLGKGYHIKGIQNPKFFQKRVGPFKVLKQLNRLAYKLEIPETFGIHDVVSIIFLEPAQNPAEDPFQRSTFHPPPIRYFDDESADYEVERIVDHKESRIGRSKKPIRRYRVRWTGFGPEHDSWYRLSELQDCLDLVNEYDRSVN